MNPQRIHEALEQIPFAEEQGFSSVWFSEHHFRPVWSHNSAPDLTLAAVSQRTSTYPPRHRRGPGPDPSPAARGGAHGDARYPEPWARRRGPRPHRLSLPAHPVWDGSARHARHVAGVCRRAAAHLDRRRSLVSRASTSRFPPREVLPKPVQRPHPPLWSACGSDETARLTGSLGMGGLFGSEGGPDRVQAADGAVSGRAANGPEQRGRASAARRADDRRLLP